MKNDIILAGVGGVAGFVHSFMEEMASFSGLIYQNEFFENASESIPLFFSYGLKAGSVIGPVFGLLAGSQDIGPIKQNVAGRPYIQYAARGCGPV